MDLWTIQSNDLQVQNFFLISSQEASIILSHHKFKEDSLHLQSVYLKQKKSEKIYLLIISELAKKYFATKFC